MHRSPSPFRTTADQSLTEFVHDFWQHTVHTAENVDEDFKSQALPLARIKKVMKSDPEVKQMVSSEVTVIFEKACQIFISELTGRSHLISLEARRRTLSRADVAQAIQKSDTFDFLIDIVPRDETWDVPGAPGQPGQSGTLQASVEDPALHNAQQPFLINDVFPGGAAPQQLVAPPGFHGDPRYAANNQGIPGLEWSGGYEREPEQY